MKTKLFNEMETFLDIETGIIYKRPAEIEKGDRVAVIGRNNIVEITGIITSIGIDRVLLDVDGKYPISRMSSQIASAL